MRLHAAAASNENTTSATGVGFIGGMSIGKLAGTVATAPEPEPEPDDFGSVIPPPLLEPVETGPVEERETVGR